MANATEPGLSTHVLDTTTGMPAVDMLIECHRLETSGWVLLSAARTDADGRINSMLSGTQLTTGDHRVNFMTGAWYARRRMDCFFPTVTIEFRVSDAARHHHIPLLVSPFSYSTYRGS